MTYDITRKQTFEELKNFWLGQMKENMTSNKKLRKISKFINNIGILIAGNKGDMFEFEEVKESTARAFAKEAGQLSN